MNKLSIAGLLSAAAIIGSVGVIKVFADDVQGYILKPAYGHMAQMERIWLDTDEISDTVQSIEDRIQEFEAHLAADPDMPKATRVFLETQLESEKKLLIRKGDKLHQSKLDGLNMLTLLQAKAV